jgi:hypothetical protein
MRCLILIAATLISAESFAAVCTGVYNHSPVVFSLNKNVGDRSFSSLQVTYRGRVYSYPLTPSQPPTFYLVGDQGAYVSYSYNYVHVANLLANGIIDADCR